MRQNIELIPQLDEAKLALEDILHREDTLRDTLSSIKCVLDTRSFLGSDMLSYEFGRRSSGSKTSSSRHNRRL
jgi:hypothetical protein